ncbi:hypothetical protein [Streptomyces sp. HUAS TT7]|uniref:hypothetical protein n=1 Tax=Streptomyces sp. HUAS TT7 TaxID=3447507 RepID=UPI003F657D58
MTASRRRTLIRASAIAAVAGSALLMPVAAAFADGPAPVTGAPGSGAPSYPADKPGSDAPSYPGDLKVTKKSVEKGHAVYALSTGHTVEMTTDRNELSAHVLGDGKHGKGEGNLGTRGDKTYTTPDGVTFEFHAAATPTAAKVTAAFGGRAVDLNFPPAGQTGKPESKPGRTAEALKVTKKDVGRNSITYTLSSGDKAELSWVDGSPSARLTGGGAEGHLSFPGGEKELVSKTGVTFFLFIPATGKEQPRVEATKGKDSVQLEFPAQSASGKGDKDKASKGKVIPKGGVKAGAEGVQHNDDTMLLAGGGAAAAAAGLGFTMLRHRKTAADN